MDTAGWARRRMPVNEFVLRLFSPWFPPHMRATPNIIAPHLKGNQDKKKNIMEGGEFEVCLFLNTHIQLAFSRLVLYQLSSKRDRSEPFCSISLTHIHTPFSTTHCATSITVCKEDRDTEMERDWEGEVQRARGLPVFTSVLIDQNWLFERKGEERRVTLKDTSPFFLFCHQNLLFSKKCIINTYTMVYTIV